MNVNDITKFKQLFIDEATNLLNSMENIILELEKNPDNLDLIQEVFRVMHTIKGVSGMYGYDAMSELTHGVENIYDLIRNEQCKVSKEVLDYTLIAVDLLFDLIEDKDLNQIQNQLKHKELTSWCSAFVKNSCKKSSVKTIHSTNKAIKTYNVILHTHQSVVDKRINVFYAIKDLADIGEIKSINSLPVDDNEEERWSIFVVGEFSKEDIEDALMFVYEYCIIRKVADFDIFNTDNLDQRQKELKNNEVNLNNLFEDMPFQEPDTVPALPKAINTNTMIESIRQNMYRVSVDSEKLDYLMYLVSEFITTSSQLNLISAAKGFEVIRPQIEKLDRLSKQFRNNALDIRLIPIRDIMPKFNRLVRDLSLNLGKEIDFITEGMDTELDKSSIDLVAEPLVHMIRNAIDHGIETPEEREEIGKSPKGEIKLKAYNSGNNIYIEISDDGKGLDKDKILNTAKKKGIIDNHQKLNEKEIFNLIFYPGFSTASEITSISGRGVGMDVVKQKISEMRGELDIKSTPEKGTTFIIKLQQSIAILDTLLVQSDKMKFLIPLTDVEVCSQRLYQDVDSRKKQGTIDYEKELIPFVSLRNLFDLNSQNRGTMAKMIVVKKNSSQYAIFADKIIGQHQAVLKPMGDLIKNHEEISAASVLGNGEVAFLLDTNSINMNLYKGA